MANKWLDNLKDLWDRLTTTRAGYLDELDFDLNARLGTPAGASLAADLLVVDNFVDDLETAVGAIEGATTLHNKLTAARAALLDQITALRMAELDPANLPADVAAISTELANATYGLSAIETLIDDLESRLTATRAAYLDFLATTEVVGPYSYLDAGAEQDVYENAVVTRRHVRVEFSNRNMTQTGTFRIYRKVDGANYDLYVAEAVLVAAGSERAFDAEFTTNQHWKLTYQENADEAAARDIPYNVILQVVE